MELNVKNLTVKYLYGAEAISALSFACRKEQIATVFAPSEGGKTTLLKTLAGLVKVTEGQVIGGGIDITNAKCKDRNVCLIYNEWGLFNNLTVKENLLYPLKIRKYDRKKQKIVESLIEQFQLTNIAHFKVKNLTNEQKIAVVFCRAFVREANFYLIDNIFAHLHGEQRKTAFDRFLPIIKQLSQKAPLVFGTDSVYEAQILGENLIILNYGIVLQKGTYQEIAHNPRSLFVCKMLFGDSLAVFDTEITKESDNLYITVGNDKIYLDKTKLINEIFIGKNVVVAKNTTNKGFLRIFDKRSEQLIYFD